MKGAIDYLAGSGEYSDRNEFPLPDVLVVDTTLGGPQPVSDLLRWLGERDEFTNVTRVAFTGSMNPKDHAALLQHGIVEVLTKGGTFEDFALSVGKVLVRCVR